MLRALVVALTAGLLSACVRELALVGGGRSRRWLLALLVTPFVTPVLLVGYAYSNTALALVRHPGWKELLYVGLLTMRLVPVCVLVLAFAPAPVSPEAVFCHRLVTRTRRGWRGLASRLAFALHGPARTWAVASGLVFLLAFSETEMAALLYIQSWTVSVFDAQTGGLALGESLRFGALPFLIEAALLILLMALLFRAVSAEGGTWVECRGSRGKRRSGVSHALRGGALAYLVVAVIVVTLVPAGIVLRSVGIGLATVLRTPVLWQDIAVSIMVAATAVVLALVGTRPLLPRDAMRLSGQRFACLCAVALPGLLGTLLLGLVALALFQCPGLHVLSATPVPLLLGLCLALLPFALVLEVLRRVSEPAAALHAAELLTAAAPETVRAHGRRLVFELRGRAGLWLVCFLFIMAYFDLTLAAMLAPPGATCVSVRLYNLMHYGQTPVLSAMVAMALAAALATLLLAGIVWPWAAGWRPSGRAAVEHGK